MTTATLRGWGVPAGGPLPPGPSREGPGSASQVLRRANCQTRGGVGWGESTRLPSCPPCLRCAPTPNLGLLKWRWLCPTLALLSREPHKTHSLHPPPRHRDQLPKPIPAGRPSLPPPLGAPPCPPQTSWAAPSPPPPPQGSSHQQGLGYSSFSGAQLAGDCFSAGWAATPGGSLPEQPPAECRNLAGGERGRRTSSPGALLALLPAPPPAWRGGLGEVFASSVLAGPPKAPTPEPRDHQQSECQASRTLSQLHGAQHGQALPEKRSTLLTIPFSLP